MKKMLLILLIGVGFGGCDNSLELTDENIKGNWYSCVEEQGYLEYHIKDEYIETYFEMFISLDLVDRYKLINDTIYFYDGVSKNYNNFYIVKSIAKDEIVVSYMSGKIITLLRIPEVLKERKWGEDIEESELFKDEFNYEFWKRKEKYDCQFSYVYKDEEGELVIEEE
ncbi:MAG: hypothetical protein COB15_08370 [Flavobacteriales bacterium]|nr:MAG: hypothetical protein COB15_08370 [Flavobacteriales bacterium]